jgi:hypothetical protein
MTRHSVTGVQAASATTLFNKLRHRKAEFHQRLNEWRP